MKKVISAVFLLVFAASAAQADMSIQFGGGWDGKSIPAGQQCTLFGGAGSTPPMKVSNLPSGTSWIYVEYNDQDYSPLSRKGGHGIIGYPVSGSSADLYSVPGLKGKLPGKARIISPAKSTGKYASDGYLPPCSGGKGHRYFANVRAISSDGKLLEEKRVDIGRY